MQKEISQFLEKLNVTYAKLHSAYENAFWVSYMGDHSFNERMKESLAKRDAFRSNADLYAQVKHYLPLASKKLHERLSLWKLFFEKYQMPKSVMELKKEIDALEAKLLKERSTRKEGYRDPVTQKFITASKVRMSMMIRTERDETVRKAVFEGLESLATLHLDGYLALVALRNRFAQTLGFEDFYAYKLQTEEGMKKRDLFKLFDEIYQKTKYAFRDIRALEKKMPGLRKPWNFGFMMVGDFTREEDPYYPFDEALDRWGRSFSAIGVNYQKGVLQLDLLDRKGKYNNGFCHWPKIVHLKQGKLQTGSSNFTCNVAYGQIGSGAEGMHTLFHEGGHAAHLLNSIQQDACINTEYPPASTAWAETQSMFLDTMFSSIEWKTRYAKNKEGATYPFDLYVRKVEKTGTIIPLNMMGIHEVMEFERLVYSAKNLTQEKLIDLAKKAYKKFFDRSEDSVSMLDVPHIYSWETACSYHGYGLAELALAQWRTYFYERDGYIVDNPKVGKGLAAVWRLGFSKTFPEMVKIATGKKLAAKSYVDAATLSVPKRITLMRKRIERMEKVKKYIHPINLNATIRMVHGKEVIADSKKGFEKMAEKYAQWLNTKK